MRRRLRRRAAPGAARPASTPSGSTCTATTRPRPSSSYALRSGVGHIVADSFDELGAAAGRAARAPAGHPRDQAHHALLHPDRPGRLEVRLPRGRGAAGGRALPGGAGSSCAGCTRTSARRCSSWRRSSGIAEVLSELGDWPLLNLGGGLGHRLHRGRRPAVDRRLRRGAAAARARGRRRCCASRAARWSGNAGVTIYTVGTVKRIPGVRTYVAVDGGMSDNLRPMLYDAVYEAEIADRFGGETECTVAGMHCESGDVLDPRRPPRRPAAGRRARDPRHRRLRPRDGQQLQRGAAAAGRSSARTATPASVVRRETYEDLTLRDA